MAEGKPDEWWQYMKYVHRMCYEEITDNCSKLGHKSINRNFDETMKCVKDSFTTINGVEPNMQKDDNSILKEEAEKWKALGSAYWPAIVINELTSEIAANHRLPFPALTHATGKQLGKGTAIGREDIRPPLADHGFQGFSYPSHQG